MRKLGTALVGLALAGIAAAIAVPNFMNFRLKARGPEQAVKQAMPPPAAAPVAAPPDRPMTAPAATPPVRPPERTPDYWVVERFSTETTWYEGADAATAAVAASMDWGALLSQKITEDLRLHFSRVARSEHALSPEEIRMLIERRMLTYLLGGSIERLAAGPGGPWRITVTYSLRRSRGGSLHLMQKERLEADTEGGHPLDTRGLHELISGAAARVAERVAPAISADILAARD